MDKDIYTFAEELNRNLSRVADASAGICPLGPSRKVKAAIRKAAKDIGMYADPGCRTLRRLFASKFGIAGDRILFANSCRELAYLAFEAFRPGRVVIAGPSATHPGLWQGAETACPGGIDEILAADAAKPGGRDLLYISNPNRITGVLSDRNELHEKLTVLSRNFAAIVLDESLIEFTSDDRFYEDATKPENLIIMRTTSNFYGLAGLELAYAVSAPATIAKLLEVCQPGLNHLALEAALTAFRDKTYIKNAKAFIRDERTSLYFGLRKIGGMTVHESDSNVYLLDAGAHRDKVLSHLARAGFMVGDCGGIEGLGGQYLRLSVMSHDRNRKLLRLIKEAAA